MPKTISSRFFKAHCDRLLGEVARTGEALLVTKDGKPFVRLVPVGPKRRRRSVFGFMKGRARIVGDILSPLDVEWEALK
jgi:antitoxin (DNA-binding transcriptional repressor) of toxin-antitoxin stability system